MNFSEEVKTTLWELIDEMGANVSDYTVNPEKDFSQKKKWDFASLVKFIISMEDQSLKNELHKYFGYTTDCPSNASFNQRSAQVSSKAFEYLFNTFTEHYENVSDKRFEYSCAAKPPVQCGESHLSRLTGATNSLFY